MKNLITTIASLLLFSMCLMQFTASEIGYLKMARAEDIISKYEALGVDDGLDCDGLKKDLAKLLSYDGENPIDQDRIILKKTSDSDKYEEYEITYPLYGVLGPNKVLGIADSKNVRNEHTKAIVKKVINQETS